MVILPFACWCRKKSPSWRERTTAGKRRGATWPELAWLIVVQQRLRTKPGQRSVLLGQTALVSWIEIETTAFLLISNPNPKDTSLSRQKKRCSSKYRLLCWGCGTWINGTPKGPGDFIKLAGIYVGGGLWDGNLFINNSNVVLTRLTGG